MSTSKDVIVIGGGAAGLFCAIEAGKRGRRVLVLERNSTVGKKIAISGGGRCNFTNLYATPKNYLSANPHFCRSALARYTPEDFIGLLEKHRIAYHEKILGQLFCNDSARAVIDMLLAECQAAGVEVRTNGHVRRVEKVASSFLIDSNQGRLACDSLIVATGGLSIPKIGATDFAFRIARQFDIPLIEPRPALVPLTLPADKRAIWKELSGVSVDAIVRCRDGEFRENLLLTHRGLSGPAILQISSYWQPGDVITINLLPQVDAQSFLLAHQHSEVHLASLLSEHLPRRFAHSWSAGFAPSRAMKSYSVKQLQEIAERLHNWQIVPDGTEGYAKAEVTAGGVDTDDLSSKTMAAKPVDGLYFIGEVVDVTGQLGGYNFQWAWASGFAAGQYA